MTKPTPYMRPTVTTRKGLVQQMLAHPEPRLTTAQAAEKLGLSRTTVVRWANAGSLPCIRTPGGHRRFPLSGLEAWEQQHTSGTTTTEDGHDDDDCDAEEAPEASYPRIRR